MIVRVSASVLYCTTKLQTQLLFVVYIIVMVVNIIVVFSTDTETQAIILPIFYFFKLSA